MERDLVFDTSALIAFFEDEPGAEQVEELIHRSNQADKARLVCVVNLGEFWYHAARNRQDGDAAILKLLSMKFAPIDANWEITRAASELKTNYKLGFADCYAAALAKLRGAELVTCDSDFKKLDRELKLRLIKGK
jgi:ribonuclease VapC